MNDWKPINVKSIESGEIIKIKDIRFNPEIHEMVEQPKETITETEEGTEIVTEGDIDFESMKWNDLKRYAKAKEVEMPFGMKKVDLIEVLTNLE